MRQQRKAMHISETNNNDDCGLLLTGVMIVLIVAW